MSDTYTPEAAAEDVTEDVKEMTAKAPKAARKIAAAATFDTAIPESVRAMAEKAVAQTRESYEKAKDTMEEAVQAFEKSFDAYGQGATSFQQKLIEIAQTNLNSSFDFAKKLTEARDLGAVATLQSEFFRQQLSAFSDQAGEIRALSTKMAEEAAEPIKSQFARSFERFPQSA